MIRWKDTNLVEQDIGGRACPDDEGDRNDQALERQAQLLPL